MPRTRKYTEEERIERNRQHSLAYYYANKDKVRQYAREYHEAHKDEAKQYYLDHRDKLLAYYRDYHFRNRMRISEERRQKYAAKKLSLTSNKETNNESKD